VSTAWKRFFAVFCRFPSPLVNGRIREGQFTGDLRDGLATGPGQSDSFLFELSRVGFLNLCHVDPFPDLIEYISALVTLSNREGSVILRAKPYGSRPRRKRRGQLLLLQLPLLAEEA
jgi:hypothetical protein